MIDKDFGFDEEDEFEKTRSDKEDEIYLKTIEKTLEDKPLPDMIPYEAPKKKVEPEIEEPPMPIKSVEEAPLPVVEEPDQVEAQEEAEPERNWEDPFETEDENCAVKKYIFAVSKDYVDTIDSMSLDERSAYINEAINLKIAKDKENDKKELRFSILRHIVIAVLTVVIGVPVMFYAVNKSIDVTINNYKYTQENFEKLYREKVKKDAIIKNSQDLLEDSNVNTK